MSFKLEEKEMKLEDNNQNVVTERVVPFFIKGCHLQKNLWRPVPNEELYGEMEFNSSMDRYTAVVNRNELVFGNLPQ